MKIIYILSRLGLEFMNKGEERQIKSKIIIRYKNDNKIKKRKIMKISESKSLVFENFKIRIKFYPN